MGHLLCTGVAVLATAFSRPTNPAKLLHPETKQSLRKAINEERAGESSRAMARLQGILLRRVRIAVVGGDARPEWTSGVRDGVEIWRRTLSDSPFQFEPSGSPAEIEVRFVPDIETNEPVQGLLRVQRRLSFGNDRAKCQLRGELLVQDRTGASGDRKLSRQEVAAVVAHELGHLLGLDDHFDGSGVMGAFRAGAVASRPSYEELSAVIALRRRARESMLAIAR